MSVRCCAAGCPSESDFSPTISFFQFPEDKERCHDWLDSIGREDLKDLSVEDVCSQYYVCSLHFDESYLQACNEDGANDENDDTAQNTDDPTKESIGQESGSQSQEDAIDDILDEDGRTKLVFVEGIGHVRLKTEDSDAPVHNKNQNSSSKDSFIFHGNSNSRTKSKVQKVIEQNGNYILYVVDENEAASVAAATAATEGDPNNNIVFVKHGDELIKVLSNTISMDELTIKSPDPQQPSKQQHNTQQQQQHSTNADLTSDKSLKVEKPDDTTDYVTSNIGEDDIVDDDDMSEIFKLTNYKTYLCHTCGRDFKDVNQLTQHMYSHHRNGVASNGEDGDEFESEGGDVGEGGGTANEDGDLMIFKCADCDQSFNMFDQLRIHVRNHVQSRNYSCDVCGAAFSHRSNLSRHKLQHCSAKKFQCDQCGKGFSQKSNLMSHQSTVHSSNGSLLISTVGFHGRPGAERVHRKPKVHSCEICGKTFVSVTGLKNHGALHTGVRPYKCAICDKSFTLMSCLKTHMATIHTDKKHYCELCGKSYQSEHYLKIHLRIHTGTKDFECELCSKRFIDLPSLKLHTRTHTGEKPFVCKMCSRSFTQQSHLKTHMRIHTGEKPYQCKDCGKFFRQLSNVLEHARTHRKS